MNRDELMRKIQEYSFAVCELELFLDTHPECKAAYEKYTSLLPELEALTDEYERMHGPIRAKCAKEGWNWINGPWPWHTGDEVKINCKGERVK